MQYEVAMNYRILQDIYVRTSLADERVKILMYIATMSRATRRYYDLLALRCREGLDVKVLLNGASRLSRRYNTPVHEYLLRSGVPSLLSKNFIHAKLLVIDDWVVTGSHNLTSSSLAGRLELALTLKNKKLADALNEEFEKLWERESEGG